MNQLDMETFSGVGNAASAILSWTARLVRTVQREQVRERVMNMKEMTMEDIRKRITYRQEGDFLVPNIGLPEKEENQPELRKYGMMRKII